MPVSICSRVYNYGLRLLLLSTLLRFLLQDIADRRRSSRSRIPFAFPRHGHDPFDESIESARPRVENDDISAVIHAFHGIEVELFVDFLERALLPDQDGNGRGDVEDHVEATRLIAKNHLGAKFRLPMQEELTVGRDALDKL